MLDQFPEMSLACQSVRCKKCAHKTRNSTALANYVMPSFVIDKMTNDMIGCAPTVHTNDFLASFCFELHFIQRTDQNECY